MNAAVEAEEVSKQFRLYHEKHTTLKERLIRFGRQRYELFWALHDVSLTVEEGQTLGLIGANGSGKTTLLKIIGGIMRPSSGVIRTQGRLAGLLELGAGFHPDLTGRENIYMNASILGLRKREIDRKFDAIVAFSELEPFIDNQVKHYSSGMYVRLGFSVAVHVEPEILLVDEVLAVGDEAFQRKCLDRVRGFQKEGRTIVVVTHAVELVREVCTHAAFLHEGNLEAHGAVNDVIRAFRDTLHGEAHLETAPLQERGSGEMRIVSVTLRDREGRQRQLFHTGEDLEVTVDVVAEQQVPDPVVGIAIYDGSGREMFGTNTADRGVSLGVRGEKTRIRFSLHALPFLEGTYRLTVGVHSPDHRTVYHWQEQAYPFRCITTGTFDRGIVKVPCDVEVEVI